MLYNCQNRKAKRIQLSLA